MPSRKAPPACFLSSATGSAQHLLLIGRLIKHRAELTAKYHLIILEQSVSGGGRLPASNTSRHISADAQKYTFPGFTFRGVYNLSFM